MKRFLAFIIFLLGIFSSFAQGFDFVADTTSGCSPLKVIFTNTTDKSIVNNYTYEWSVEVGKYFVQTDSVQKTYITPGTYSVSMRVKDGNKIIQTITKENEIKLLEKKSEVIKENQKLTAMRDKLLPLLMNGQVVVE